MQSCLEKKLWQNLFDKQLVESRFTQTSTLKIQTEISVLMILSGWLKRIETQAEWGELNSDQLKQNLKLRTKKKTTRSFNEPSAAFHSWKCWMKAPLSLFSFHIISKFNTWWLWQHKSEIFHAQPWKRRRIGIKIYNINNQAKNICDKKAFLRTCRMSLELLQGP